MNSTTKIVIAGVLGALLFSKVGPMGLVIAGVIMFCLG